MSIPQLAPEPDSSEPVAPLDLLGGLPAAERHAICLARTSGVTYREVAVVLGVSEDDAKRRIRSGLQRMRSTLVRTGVVPR